MCGRMDGSALHILGEHCAPRLPGSATAGALGPLALLQTDKPPGELRRNIRLVGQLLGGGSDWGWLPKAPALTGRQESQDEHDGLAGNIEALIADAAADAGEEWNAVT